MIVVAIIGLIAAIAIPAYTGYIQRSKINSLIENHRLALRYIQSEASKFISSATVCSGINNIITALNSGDKLAIGTPTSTAFADTTAPAAGQIGIDGLNGNGCVVANNAITISVGILPGTNASTDYPGGIVDVSFTPE